MLTTLRRTLLHSNAFEELLAELGAYRALAADPKNEWEVLDEREAALQKQRDDYPNRTAYCPLYHILTKMGLALAGLDRAEKLDRVARVIDALGWTPLQHRRRDTDVEAGEIEAYDGEDNDRDWFDLKYGDPFVARATVAQMLTEERPGKEYDRRWRLRDSWTVALPPPYRPVEVIKVVHEEMEKAGCDPAHWEDSVIERYGLRCSPRALVLWLMATAVVDLDRERIHFRDWTLERQLTNCESFGQFAWRVARFKVLRVPWLRLMPILDYWEKVTIVHGGAESHTTIGGRPGGAIRRRHMADAVADGMVGA